MDDMISRQAVMDIMHDMWGDSGELLEALKELSSVQPITTSEDCISRQEAIDAIPNPWCTSDGNIYNTINIVHKIMDLPSVQPKHGEWISVEDRLPSGLVDVLVTCFIHENWQVKYGYYNGQNWIINAYGKDWKDLEVKAWQPLPEPYKQI